MVKSGLIVLRKMSSEEVGEITNLEPAAIIGFDGNLELFN